MPSENEDDVLFRAQEFQKIGRIRAFIAERPHLQALQGDEKDWSQAVFKSLELFDSPHNLDQLWVWSRFVYLFGQRDTWTANRELETLLVEAGNLLSLRSFYHQLEDELESTAWYRFKRRAHIIAKLALNASAIQKSLLHVCAMLMTYIDRDRRWIDKEDFTAYSNRVHG